MGARLGVEKARKRHHEQKVFGQLKPMEPVQKLPQVAEEALLEAMKTECWWKAWVKVRPR